MDISVDEMIIGDLKVPREIQLCIQHEKDMKEYIRNNLQVNFINSTIFSKSSNCGPIRSVQRSSKTSKQQIHWIAATSMNVHRFPRIIYNLWI